MKKTDLEKNKALKLVGKMKQGMPPGRFAGDSATASADRREQRKRDQEQGLVSFPIKIKQELIESIRERAAAQGRSVSEIAGELLDKALKD